MGFLNDMWKSAKATGDAALAKWDQKMDAVRDDLAQYDVKDPNELERLLNEAMVGNITLSAQQLAALKELAKKRTDGLSIRPLDPPGR